MRVAVMTVALALALSTLTCFAQFGGAPGQNAGPGGGPTQEQGPRKFHVLPPQGQEQLNLTADQRRQVADLETQVTAKMKTILTAEQLQKWSQMRPPQRGQGGGPQQGGPGGGQQRGGGPGDSQDPPNP